MNIFLAEIQNKNAILNEEESLHCAKVLRMKEGDVIQLLNGSGKKFNAVLTRINAKQCEAEIQSEENNPYPRNYYLHLAISPTKQNERIEWMLEKCVEIGIDEISFIRCKNSERTAIKLERMNKIVLSAVKQSLQFQIPKVNEIRLFNDFIGTVSSDCQKLIAHCANSEKKDFNGFKFKNEKTLVLIGPEGDFTNEEIALANNQSFVPVSLGNNRLRTETAGLVVCQTVSILSAF